MFFKSDAYRRAATANNFTTQQATTSPTTLSPLNAPVTLMNTKKEAITSDGQVKGLDGKKRD
jgi:hypothetical protein